MKTFYSIFEMTDEGHLLRPVLYDYTGQAWNPFKSFYDTREELLQKISTYAVGRTFVILEVVQAEGDDESS